MSETESVEALDHKIIATWEQERTTPDLRSYIGSLATRIGLEEYDIEAELDNAA